MKLGTLLVTNKYSIDAPTGALSIPVYQASTFHQDDVENGQQYEYSRSGNPTRQALEGTIALLEGGCAGFAFASGMAATSAVLSIFSAGDHIIVCEDVYGGTYRAVTSLFSRFKMEFTFADASRPEEIAAAVRDNTRALFLETPSNPLLKITDLRAAVLIAREHGLLTILDNTFMSPYLQRPLALGFNIVIHSATKFIGGHSDVVAGLVVAGDPVLARKIYQVQTGYGAILGPQDSWLLLRGLKTLKVRLDYQQASALKLAEVLNRHPGVVQVYYPGLPDHPGREIHYSQADGPGAVLSFRTGSTASARRFMERVRLAAVAVSLGGVETIVSYPVKMSHAAMHESQRLKLGITDDLIRISVGLEDPDDLIADFEGALNE